MNGTCVACIGTDYSFACDACDGNPEVCTRCVSGDTGTGSGFYSLVAGQCVFTEYPPAPVDDLSTAGDLGVPDALADPMI